MEHRLAFFQEAFEVAPVGMLVVDSSGVIVEVNRQLAQLFQYDPAQLVGQPVELLVAGVASSHREYRERFFHEPVRRPMGAGRDLYGRRRDGVQVPVEIGLTPLTTPTGGVLVLAAIVDITERKQAREALQAGLREKETLLRELQHRAKNNLQLIASLLDLSEQSGPEALHECRERVHTIALVHEKLYQSGTLARLELADYLRSLGEQVALTWARAENSAVQLRIEAQDLWLPLEHAVPSGLLINELLTNAFKHAFPNGRSGTITVSATKEEGQVIIVVADDGIGQPGGMRPRPGHIGFELVTALSRQLRATLTFDTTSGTRVRLSFPAVER